VNFASQMLPARGGLPPFPYGWPRGSFADGRRLNEPRADRFLIARLVEETGIAEAQARELGASWVSTGHRFCAKPAFWLKAARMLTVPEPVYEGVALAKAIIETVERLTASSLA
jgi:hypothetical protein